MTSTICESCGIEFEPTNLNNPNRFCSQECYHKWAQGENNPKYKEKIIKVCEECGEEFKVRPFRKDTARFCSRSCKGKWVMKHHNPAKREEIKKKISTALTGKSKTYPAENNLPIDVSGEKNGFYGKRHSEDTRRKMSRNHADVSGANNPQWKGGVTEKYYSSGYGWEWNKIREQILERDDYTCQVCGSEQNLHVHHLIPVYEFEEISDAHFSENLIVLCNKCHPKVEVGNIESLVEN